MKAKTCYTYGSRLLWILSSSALILALVPQYESDQVRFRKSAYLITTTVVELLSVYYWCRPNFNHLKDQLAKQQADNMRMQHQQMVCCSSRCNFWCNIRNLAKLSNEIWACCLDHSVIFTWSFGQDVFILVTLVTPL